MLKQVGTGAAAVFAVGILAAGCSDKGDTFIVGGGQSDLVRADALPGGSSLNTDTSGFGLSPNGVNVETNAQWKVTWACDTPGEGTFAGDDSAILLVRTAGPLFRTLAFHYRGGSDITPPVELTADDRDETQPVDIASAVVFYLGTQGYTASGAGSAQQANEVRANAGGWVIAVAGTTRRQDPKLASTQAITGASAIGARRTIWAHVFAPALRGQGLVFVDGTVIKVGDHVGNFSHGFQMQGVEVPHIRTGQATDGGGALQVPAADVQSFGIASDGFASQASFSGAGVPFTGTNAVPTAGAPGANAYQTGQRTTFAHLFYTQIVTSLDSGPSIIPTAGGSSVYVGSALKAFRASLDLKTLRFATPTRVDPPAHRTTAAGHFSDVATSPGVGFFPTFHTYNGLVFFRYMDAHLTANTAGQDNAVGIIMQEHIIGKMAIRDNGDGTSGLVPSPVAAIQDLATRVSGTGLHSLTNHTFDGGGTQQTAAEREVMDFNTDGAQFIYGRDEGLHDTTIFFTTTDNTVNGGIDDGSADGGNTDRFIAAAVIDAAGELLQGQGNNPRMISVHQNNGAVSSTLAEGSTNVLTDPVGLVSSGATTAGDSGWFRAQMNRTGTYVLVGYLQAEGNSRNYHIGQMVVAYQTLRHLPNPTAANPQPALSLNDRVSSPLVLSAPASTTDIGLSTQTTAVTTGHTVNHFNRVPVNEFKFQDAVGYRSGFQTDLNTLAVLFEQSDGTEDRLFIHQVRVTTNLDPAAVPLVESLSSGNPVEIEPTDNVVSARQSTIASNATSRTQFRFLNQTASIDQARLHAIDVGATQQQAATPTGPQGANLLVTYRRVVDNTDNSAGTGGTTGQTAGSDTRLFLARLLRGESALQERVAISRPIHEDNAPAIETTQNEVNPDLSAAINNADTARDFCLVPVPTRGNLGAHAPNAAYVYFTAPKGPNARSARGLFTRKVDLARFRSGTTAGGSTALTDNIIPSAGVSGPGTTGYQEPTRLDALLGGDVVAGSLNCEIRSGTGSIVLWEQDSHLWAQATNDGVNFLTQAGAPNPALVDNQSSSNVDDVMVSTCHDADQDVRSSLILFRKPDIDSNNRLRAIGGTRP